MQPHRLIPEFTVIVERQRINVSSLRAPGTARINHGIPGCGKQTQHKTAAIVVSGRHVFRIR